jgi:heme exporter protein D
MNWHSASEFFQMGGYGLYVWGAYGVTALVMVVEPWLASRRHRRARDEAAQPPFADEAAQPPLQE